MIDSKIVNGTVKCVSDLNESGGVERLALGVRDPNDFLDIGTRFRTI